MSLWWILVLLEWGFFVWLFSLHQRSLLLRRLRCEYSYLHHPWRGKFFTAQNLPVGNGKYSKVFHVCVDEPNPRSRLLAIYMQMDFESVRSTSASGWPPPQIADLSDIRYRPAPHARGNVFAVPVADAVDMKKGTP